MKYIKLLLLICLVLLSIRGFAGAQDDFWTACLQCDLEGVTKSVSKGADVKAMHSSNQNALALSYFCPNVTAYLIEQGVDPMSDGGGALVGAANNYSYEVVKLLLEAGADPNAVSPIYAANAIDITLRQTNCVPCLQLLADNGADLKYKKEDGTSYAHTFAVFSMTADQRNELFAKGKSAMEGYGLKVPDWYGNFSSDRNGTPAQMLDILVKGGCDLNSPIKKGGYTPLMLAIGIVPGAPAKHEAAMALLDQGVDVNQKTDQKINAIALAASMDNAGLLKKIIEMGADVNTEYWWLDSELGVYLKGWTPLALAAKYGNLENTKVLFDAGAKPGKGVHGLMLDPADNCLVFVRDKSSIYYAIESGDPELVKVFTDNFKFWNNNVMTLKKPEKSHEADYGNYTVKTTSCKGSKAPIRPGMYAKQLGFKDVQSQLASSGL